MYKPAVLKPPVPVTKGLGWVVLLALCLSCLEWWSMIVGHPATQVHDGPFYQKMVEVARVSITRYGELPLWNPFECGGVPLWDNPQGLGAAPLMYLTLLVGSTRTVEIWYLLHSAVGMLCMWVLARQELRLSPAASVVAAASFAFAGAQTNRFSGGHFVFVCFLYTPLAIVLWRRAERDLRAAVGLGLLAALIMLEGGTYPLPYLAVLLGVETLFRVWPLRRVWPIAKAAVVVSVVAFSVGAMRFLPVIDQLMHHQRENIVDTDAMQWSTLKDIFLVRSHGRGVDGQQYVWGEFGDYLGPMIFCLACLGIFTLHASELWILGLFLFSFLLMCGHFSPWAPWSVLNTYVFPFKQMRVPSRFVEQVTLFLSLFAALAVDRLPRRLRFSRVQKQKAFAGFLVAVGLIGVGDEISVGTSYTAQAFTGAPQDFKLKPAARLHYGPSVGAFLDTPHTNVADLGCWEEWAFERDAPLWLGDVPQARGGSGSVHVLVADRTPNTFTVDVDLKAPGRLLLNSTYDRGWRTDVGTVVENGKMLAVDLPAGTFTVHVKYWPHGLTLGLILSGLSVLALAFAIGRAVYRRIRSGRRCPFGGTLP